MSDNGKTKKERFIEDVYNTLQGVLIEGYRVPGVENAFEEGKFCMVEYCRMLDAYERLCDRLGSVDEDEDVDVIIGALLGICRELSFKMFSYGVKFSKEMPAEEKQ